MRTSRSTAAIPEDIARVLSKADAIPVRTRGPSLKKQLLSFVTAETLTLTQVVDGLRENIVGLPLTFVIHGWGTAQAMDFYLDLEPLLDGRDGLWFIPAGEQMDEPEGGIVLNLNHKTDMGLYTALVGDLVFFSGQETGEGITRWARRALGGIIVDQRGDYHNEIVLRLGGFETITYSRDEEGNLEQH